VHLKFFAINPGSTSTKIALFEGEKELFSKNVSHDASKLKEFKEIKDQLPYRKETILHELATAHISLQGVDAFSARGGGLVSVKVVSIISVKSCYNMQLKGIQ